MSSVLLSRLRGMSGWGAPLVMLIVICVWIEVLRPGSFAMDQLALKCAGALTLIFVATGQTIVILRGGIDLSVGGILSLATAIAVTRADASFVELIPWLLLILGVGAGIGMLNGAIISVLGLQPFLVTLATWSIVEGVALTVLPAEGGTVPGAWFSAGYSTVLGLPISVFLLLVLIAWWSWFRRTRLASRIRALTWSISGR